MKDGLKKYKNPALFAGIGFLFIGVVCVIVNRIVGKNILGILYEWGGVKASQGMLRRSLKALTEAYKASGVTLPDLLGIPVLRYALLRLSMALTVPCFVLGILCMAVWGIAFFFEQKPEYAEIAQRSLNNGLESVKTAVMDTLDKAAVKCHQCGKMYTAKTAFCTDCGAKLPEPEPAKNVCVNCGHINRKSAAFCAQCGTKLESVVNQNAPDGTEADAKGEMQCGQKAEGGES